MTEIGAGSAPPPAWDGESGEAWVATAARHEATLGRLTPWLLDAARPAAGENVLEVGAGCGEVAVQVASLVAPGEVLGADISGPMLAAARERATRSGTPNLRFVHADAETHPFAAAGVDLVISRFGVMFFADPAAAFANLGRAARTDGRLAFLCWQARERNEHIHLPERVAGAYVPLPRDDDGPGPWSLADPDHVRALLRGAGWDGIAVDPVEQPLRVGEHADDVLAYYRTQPWIRSRLAGVPPDLLERILAAIHAELASHETADGVVLSAAAWLVTAHRGKVVE